MPQTVAYATPTPASHFYHTLDYPEAGRNWQIGEYDFVRGRQRWISLLTNQVVDANLVYRRAPRCLQLDSYSTQSYISCYDVNNATNAVRAFVERMVFVPDDQGGFVFPPKPRPDAYAHAGLLRHAKAAFSCSPCDRYYRMTMETFVRTSPAHKRKLYGRAAESLMLKPISAEDAKLTTFLKMEKADFAKKLGVPRLINPRDPRFNVEWGRYIRQVEKRIYAQINHAFGYTIVAKGMNASQRGATIHERWRRFIDPVAVGGDARRFDQHVSAEALRWTHSVYRTYFERQELVDFGRLASWTINNRGVLRYNGGTLRWQRTGGRQSGDMDTSLGNIVLMCGFLYEIARRCEALGHRIEFVDDGDDFVAFMERRSQNVFNQIAVEVFLACGFEVDFEPTVDVIEHVEFCQCHPVYVDGTYKLCRDYRAAIAKDLVVINRSAQEAFSILKSIGVGGVIAYGDMPILGAHYKRLRMVPGRAARMQLSGWAWLTHNMTSNSYVSDDTRLSFQRAFGVSVHNQLLLEQHIASAPNIQRAEYPTHIEKLVDIHVLNCLIPDV